MTYVNTARIKMDSKTIDPPPPPLVTVLRPTVPETVVNLTGPLGGVVRASVPPTSESQDDFLGEKITS